MTWRPLPTTPSWSRRTVKTVHAYAQCHMEYLGVVNRRSQTKVQFVVLVYSPYQALWSQTSLLFSLAVTCTLHLLRCLNVEIRQLCADNDDINDDDDRNDCFTPCTCSWDNHYKIILKNELIWLVLVFLFVQLSVASHQAGVWSCGHLMSQRLRREATQERCK